ncbi:MAG: 16S rRNA (cytosine(967)-C(5))-methyltransferase RsmB [Clostridia bacterium]|nr:16S rRNA (cytosine(967)-C(5))-methyltransferase RsmB [Clostridia bacterium]
MIDRRKIALLALCDIEKDLSYSNLVLRDHYSKFNVPDTDKPFITALFYGVLDRMITLDYVISAFVKKPLKSIGPITLSALRLAIYQILFMDKVPESAAVNESVRLVKNSKESYNSGFVNAVLRNYLRQGVTVPEDNSVSSLKYRYSVPEWIIESLIGDYGIENAVKTLDFFLRSPKTALRVNSTLISDSAFEEVLQTAGVKFETTDLPHALLLDSGVDVTSLPGYKEGYFHIEDLPSQYAISALNPIPGGSILDMCAAPGGKSFTAAQYAGNEANVTSCDFYESRVSLIENGAKRLKLGNIKCLQKDSTVFDPTLGKFDYVICDVPCSGLGVIRRKPEIKYKTDLNLSALADAQLAILNNGIHYLNVGGKLIYSTCTLRKAENEDIVRRILCESKNLVLESEKTFLPPTDGTDGFYYAIIVKN